MARIGDNILPAGQIPALTLDRYQEIMRLPINAFNGLNNPDETPVYECSTIWKQGERDQLAMYISKAEEYREEELSYHLAPKYIVDEEHSYGVPVILNRKHLITPGIVATSTIEAGVTLDHGVSPNVNDPVVITVTTLVTSTDEIRVFYPGEDVEIHPSSVSISGGVATIQIPRARLVDPDYNDNRDDPLDYYDNSFFLATVDVSRVYTDTGLGSAYIVWDSVGLVVAGALTYPSSTEYAQPAVFQVLGHRARRISKVHVYPGNSTATAGSAFYYSITPNVVRISYLSGRVSSLRTENETAKLSHVLAPAAPVTCPYVKQMWEEDRVEDPSGLVTPYGNQRGAVQAWISDSRAKVGHGGKF